MYYSVIENNIQLLTHLQNTSLGIENHLITKGNCYQTDTFTRTEEHRQQLTHLHTFAHTYPSLTTDNNNNSTNNKEFHFIPIAFT